MSDEKFKLPRSSYDELVKIIKTYGQFQEPKSLGEVSKLVGMNDTKISANNAFLLQVEILEPGKKKAISPKGRSLAQALEHEMPDQIRDAWYKVVEESKFLQNLVASVRIRKGMDDTTLQSHIAYSAGEAKKSPVMTGARAVIDILRAADAIKEEDGKLVVVQHDTTKAIEPKGQEVNTPQITAREPQVETQQAASIDISHVPGVTINIEVRVDCKVSDLDDLGEKLKSIIDSLNNKSFELEE